MDVETEPENGVRVYSRARIYALMAAAVIAAAIAGWIFGNLRFAWGVILGGLLSYGNFAWLENSTKGLFSQMAEGRRSIFPAARFIFRYLALGAILWVIYKIEIAPIAAVLVGLSAFAVAVMFDGIYSIFIKRK